MVGYQASPNTKSYALPVIFDNAQFLLSNKQGLKVGIQYFIDSVMEIIGSIHDNPELMKEE